MISLDLFDCSSMTKLDKDVTKYVNDNVKCIIRVLLDYLEDNNDFAPEDFLPYNNFRIDNALWTEMVYDLYDIVRSDVVRECVKPVYEYLLYVILQWWEDCADSFGELIPYGLDDNLAQRIKEAYVLENRYNYILEAITNFDEYYYILFADHDFLPDSLERLVTIYIRNPKRFEELFGDVDLRDYRVLMPKDLQEQFDNLINSQDTPNEKVLEAKLLEDILFCCERVQSRKIYNAATENNINDQIRGLLRAMRYDARDQTRQGTSSKGKEAGEVDILISEDNSPCAIIEALVLKCCDEAYISEHIDKIYNYDTRGNDFNFIISYVRTKNFAHFWDKYLKYTEAYNYPHKLQQYISTPVKQYPELRCSLAVLMRNDIATKLYHISVHMPC